MKLDLILFITVFTAFISSSCTNEVEDKSDDLTRQKANEIVSTISEPVIGADTIDLIEYSGHIADGKKGYDFRQDIQAAIDQLSANGGGTLIFRNSQGSSKWVKSTEIYRIRGPIEMKSGVCLALDYSVELFFEFDPPSYTNNGEGFLTRYEGTTIYGYSPLIRGFNAENIAIKANEGHGAMPCITGDGEKWQMWSEKGQNQASAKGELPSYVKLRRINNQDMPVRERIFAGKEDYLRPAMIQFLFCKNILIEGVFLKDSPFWVVHPVFSENMIFREIVYDCQNVNNDGIDVESSRKVLIEDIIFNNHDDNVAIKAGRDQEGIKGANITGTEIEELNSPYIKDGRLTGPTSEVVVRDCVFKGHHAFAIGSEMSGGANNIYVHDNIANQDVYMGVYLKGSRKRGGVISDIFVQDMELDNVKADVIALIPNYDGDTTSSHPPKFKNIFISGIKAERAEHGIRIFGWPDALTENVHINDVNIEEVTSEENDSDFTVSFAKDVFLKEVIIEGKEFEGDYTNLKGKKPPKTN
jgi:polygalacturonase